MTDRFRLLTNHHSNTCLSLSAAARALGGAVRVIGDFEDTDELVRWEPTGAVIFLYGWPDAGAEALDSLKRLDIPTAVWQVDDPHFFFDPKLHDVTVKVARNADFYFSHTRQLDSEYAALGICVRYLPTAARLYPGIHELVLPPPPDQECQRDWAFIGTVSPARRSFLKSLEERLPSGMVGQVITQIEPREALAAYRSSRVTLSVSTASEGGPAPSVGLTERTWDVPLVGGFLLQDDRPYLSEHFAIGEEAITFRDVDECARKLVYFCSHPEERRQVAARAQRRVLSEHLMVHRLMTIVNTLRERAPAPDLAGT